MAKSIRESLFQRLKFTDDGLVLGIPGRKLSESKPQKGLFTLDNMLLANFYCTTQRTKRAVRIVEAIDKQIGRDPSTNLYHRSQEDKRLYTYVNAIAAYTLNQLADALKSERRPN